MIQMLIQNDFLGKTVFLKSVKRHVQLVAESPVYPAMDELLLMPKLRVCLKIKCRHFHPSNPLPLPLPHPERPQFNNSNDLTKLG